VWAVAAGGCRPREEGHDRALRLLPKETDTLLVVRPAAFADTDAFRKVEQQLMDTEGVGEVLRESDVRLGRDVENLYLALYAAPRPSSDGGSAHFTALLHTRLDDGVLGRVLERSRHSFRSEQVAGVPVWVSGDETEPVAVASLPKGFIGLGPVDAVRAMAHRARNHAAGLDRSAPLLRDAGALEWDSPVWGVARMSGALAGRARANPMTQGFGAVHTLSWTARYGPEEGLSVRVSGVCASEADALRIKTNAETLLALATLAENLDPALGRVMQSASVRVEKNAAVLRVTVPPDVLSEWAETADGGPPALPRLPSPR
jgi:hypothetical protein